MEETKENIKCSYTELIPLHKLVEHPKNPNKHPDEQIKRLSEIIDYQGMRSPIVVSLLSGFITKGHGRLAALKRLGWENAPIDYQEYIDEAQEYADIVADNAISSWADLDLSIINQDFLDLGPDLDIDMLGIKDFVIEPIEKFEAQSDEDSVPEVVNPITKRGDVWLLGDHRVMCGDSTMIDDVEKLMSGEKADMVFTDPPYGMKLNADYSDMKNNSKNNSSFAKNKGIRNGKRHENVIGDHDDFSPELINTIFSNFGDCKEVFIWGADYFSEHLIGKNEGSWVVWDKRVTESFDKMYGSAFELCWSKNKHKRDIARVRWASAFGTEQEFDHKRHHPTQKPHGLIEWFFEKWCDGLTICADLFLGSGSTLIACEKTNRKCYGMELDEKYCDVIINRWQKYTGKEATLESNGETYNSLKVE